MTLVANTKTIVRFYQTVKPHQPLIRFRHGVPEINKPDSISLTPATGTVHMIEDSLLPRKFKRTQLDEAEINTINSGGAE